MSLETLLPLSCVAFFASLVIGLTGMGFGIVAMGFFPLFLPVAESNVIVSLLSIPVILANLVGIRRHIQFRMLLPVLVTTLVFVPIGVWGLVRLNERVLLIGLGALIFVSLIVSQIATHGHTRSPSLPLAVLAGALSGTFGGAYSISGPPVALYLTTILADKRDLKASLLFHFLIQIIFRLALFTAGGVATAVHVKTALVLLIPVGLGFATGVPLFNRIPSLWMRRLTQGMLAISSIVLIIRAV